MKPAAPPPKIFVEERQALDKAKTVEGTVLNSADDARKKIDDATKQ